MTLPFSARRNCNLDLMLTPAGMDSVPVTTDSGNNSMTHRSAETPQQRLTIFYNGQVSACDVTELQARAIICLARREMEEKMNTPRSESISPLQSQLHNPTGMSMKRSLQQFLQKRKNRIQSASPYNNQQKNKRDAWHLPLQCEE
ncbi:protein TIFY 5A-like [Macadamia integrifolia]|uniref:protein TIFY 5A-like n=1 Tax=Macadamia integrifolia TaxID=60698 RepID=UPI001C52AAC6|nr:protein TIFY 5A-like [Macadamia integrifolia]